MGNFFQRINVNINANKVRLKSTFLYLAGASVSAVIGVSINPFLAKHLAPHDYAIMGYFNAFGFLIVPLLNFGLITYYQRNYFRLPDDRKKVVGDTILISVLVFGLFALLLISVALYLYWRLSKVSFPFFPYALLSLAPSYLNNFATLYLLRCRLQRDARQYSRITIANAVISAVLALVLVVFYELGAIGRMTATLGAAGLIAAYSLWKLIDKLEFNWKIAKEAFLFGVPISLSAILWYFLDGVDRAMLEPLNDKYTFGFYTVGIQIAAYFSIFYTAIANAFEPDIYQAISQNNRRKLAKIIGFVITVNAIPNLIFIVFAPIIIGLLTYNRYKEAAGFAQILALKNITTSFYYMTIFVIVGYGFVKAEVIIRAMGVILCFAMYKILINNFGFYGAAWGQVLSMMLLSILGLMLIAYKVKKGELV